MIQSALAKFRRRVGAPVGQEVKKNLDDSEYLELLHDIDHPLVVLFAVATDTGMQTIEQIQDHQHFYVNDLRKNIPRMKFEGGREGLTLLAQQLEGLSPQLYVQLFCQTILLYKIISVSTTYFAQRHPPTLSTYRWRIDPKDKTRTKYEQAFVKLAPALAQGHFIRNPMTFYRGLNYSHMKPFELTEETYPTYLQSDHGLPHMDGLDLGKILRQHVDFPDSQSSDGIQIADILARCLKRALESKFDNPQSIARLIGKLTTRLGTAGPSIELVGFSGDRPACAATSAVIEAIAATSRPVVLRNR